jgi:hypothetical protein
MIQLREIEVQAIKSAVSVLQLQQFISPAAPDLLGFHTLDSEFLHNEGKLS